MNSCASPPSKSFRSGVRNALILKVLLAVQVLSALAIIILVLLQQGKGADMGSAFGSGSAGSLFGATGAANFLSRMTKWSAVVFFATTAGLAYVSHKGSSSVLDGGVMQNFPADRSVPQVPGGASVPGGSSVRAHPRFRALRRFLALRRFPARLPPRPSPTPRCLRFRRLPPRATSRRKPRQVRHALAAGPCAQGRLWLRSEKPA